MKKLLIIAAFVLFASNSYSNSYSITIDPEEELTPSQKEAKAEIERMRAEDAANERAWRYATRSRDGRNPQTGE